MNGKPDDLESSEWLVEQRRLDASMLAALRRNKFAFAAVLTLIAAYIVLGFVLGFVLESR